MTVGRRRAPRRTVHLPRRIGAPRSRRARRERSSPIGLVLTIALLATVLVLSSHLGGWIDQGKRLVGRDGPGTVALGTSVHVDRTTFHPGLDVRADHLVRTRVRSGVGAPRGERLLAVRVSIHNRGNRPWDLPGGAAASITDSLGITHRSTAVGPIRAGRLLPRDLRLRPGGRASGYVVFAVPADRSAKQLRLELAPVGEDVVRWQVRPGG